VARCTPNVWTERVDGVFICGEDGARTEAVSGCEAWGDEDDGGPLLQKILVAAPTIAAARVQCSTLLVVSYMGFASVARFAA
jgi:hypothetical protein